MFHFSYSIIKNIQIQIDVIFSLENYFQYFFGGKMFYLNVVWVFQQIKKHLNMTTKDIIVFEILINI